MPERGRLRPWAGWEDLPALQGVCSRRLAAAPGRSDTHPGDVAWWTGWPPRTPDALARDFLVWEVEEVVVGWASVDDGALVVVVDPAHRGGPDAVTFEEEAVAWAAAAAPGPVRLTELALDEAACERWRGRGFEPADGGYATFVRRLDAAVDREPGERVAPVGDDDVADRAAVTHAAFGNARELEPYAADYAAFRAGPAYPAGWDLLARAPDGAPAACCIAWPDPASGAGLFEPVATHPDHRRRGHASAVMAAGLARLAAAGMTWAIVITPASNGAAVALYRSLGFVPDSAHLAFVRP
jgi:ribosomal protein S18 acetylase RimI-like enzyme